MAQFQYTSIDDIRNTYLQQLSTAASTDVQVLNNIIDAVTLGVERYTNRRFYTTSTDVTIDFDGPEVESRQYLAPLDIASLTSVALAADTVAAASGTYTTIDTVDWYLRPIAGTAERPDGWPATKILLAEEYSGTYSNSSQQYMWFQPGMETVRLTGKFGWNTTTVNSTNFPQDIRHAAAEWTIGLWRARNSGAAQEVGFEGLGTVQISRTMPASVRMVLDAYRVWPVR